MRNSNLAFTCIILAMAGILSSCQIPKQRTCPLWDSADEWEGGEPDRQVVRESGLSIRWAHAESPSLRLSFEPPGDWSKFSAVTFWLHSQKATHSKFMFLIFSESEDTEGIDYYSLPIRLDWTGWKEFQIPFREMGKARSPIGLHKIDSVVFSATGWNNTPDPSAVVRLDGLALTQFGRRGKAISDEEFFAMLDYERPGLEEIRSSIQVGDMAQARRQLATYVRERREPKWFFDWRDHPMPDICGLTPEADRAPEQWDYYSTFIDVDWQGWKHFSFSKEDFISEAMVEGEGWKGKKPIGWHCIRYIALNSTGWEMTPDPETVLYLDDIRVVGPDGTFTIADFETENRNFSHLERCSQQAKSGNWSGKWENQVTNTRLKAWNIPHDWTQYEQLEFWAYSEKVTRSRFILLLDSDWPASGKKADEYVNKKFSKSFGNQNWTVEFEGDIDWAANPTEGEARTHL